MKKKILLLSKPSVNQWQFPYLWASAKTYYQEQGLYSDHWEWIDPMIVINDWEEKLESAISMEPDLIGFSLYTWNEGTFNKMAKILRERLPNAIIIFGGPQCDVKYNKEYFRQKPYVDMVVPGDAYGEIIFKEVLDNIIDNGSEFNPANIPYCYYPDNDKNIVAQDNPIDKKNFQWPSNPFRAQQEYFNKYIDMTNPSDHGWIMLETSRGCPYRCSFCDWGGGTHTKTIKKPFATVLDEIRWVGENKIYGVYISDANFGLFDIDIEYAKYIVKASKEHGYPKMVTIQPTKTKIKNLETIFEIFAEAKLLPQFKIAVEDLNEHVLKNIDRVDFPFEQKMEMIDRLREKYDLPLFVEGILGLPGSSMDTIRKDIERTIGRGVEFPLNHPWVLLPETPAYAPDYREKWGLKTIENKNGLGSSSIPLKIKKGFEPTTGVTVIRDDGTDLTAEYVVGTYSYTPEEYVNMTAMQIFVSSLHNGHLLNLVGKYMREVHDVEWGEFYIDIKTFLQSHEKLGEEFRKVDSVVKDWLDGDSGGLWVDWRDDFKYEMQPYNFIMLMALTESEEFYGSIGRYLSEKYDDPKIIEVCEYSKFNVYNINYEIGKEQSFDHNWKEWGQGEDLVNDPVTYKTLDEEILVGQKMMPIDWQEKQGTPDYLTHFFYRVCYAHIAKKDVKKIERV